MAAPSPTKPVGGVPLYGWVMIGAVGLLALMVFRQRKAEIQEKEHRQFQDALTREAAFTGQQVLTYPSMLDYGAGPSSSAAGGVSGTTGTAQDPVPTTPTSTVTVSDPSSAFSPAAASPALASRAQATYVPPVTSPSAAAPAVITRGTATIPTPTAKVLPPTTNPWGTSTPIPGVRQLPPTTPAVAPPGYQTTHAPVSFGGPAR